MNFNFRYFLKIKYLKLIFFLIFSLNQIFSYERLYSDNQKIQNNSKIWEIDNSTGAKSNYIWELDNEIFDANVLNKEISYANNFFYVRALGNSISVNGHHYPEVSNYVPNAILEDSNKFLTSNFRFISKTRHCNGTFSNCADAILNIDYAPFVTDKYSLGIKSSIQSLTSRGTKFGQGATLGFKSAWEISPNSFIAFGAEHIIHLDNTVDLGRNLFLVFTNYQILNNNEKPSMLVLNAGIGSDFFGYKGNGFLGTTYCFGENTLTGDGSNKCQWGPIMSLSYVVNHRLSINTEWFGYGYGTGISMRPFPEKSLSLSIYATDFITNFPNYINTGSGQCNPDCNTRYYGGITLSF